MIIKKIRFTQKIRACIETLKIEFFGVGVRITAGYVIGLAMDKLPDVKDYEWKLAVVELEGKKNTEEYSTSLTLRQEVYDKLISKKLDLENRFSRAFRLSEVIELILSVVCKLVENEKSVQEETNKDATNIIDIINLADNIDFLVFKQEYEISSNPQKQLLYTIVREYLEKNESLNAKMREATTRWVRSISDYYNPERYTPQRGKTFGTANILFISKAVAGFILVIAEIESIAIEAIIRDIKSEISLSQ